MTQSDKKAKDSEELPTIPRGWPGLSRPSSAATRRAHKAALVTHASRKLDRKLDELLGSVDGEDEP